MPGIRSIRQLLTTDTNVAQPATQAALFGSPNPQWLIYNPNFKREVGLRREASQADLRVDWNFGGGYSLTSITAQHFDKYQIPLDLNYRDATSIANPYFTAASAATRVPWLQFMQISQNRLKDFSQELRLTSPSENRFRWTVGGNYIDIYIPGGTVFGIAPSPGPNFSAAITRQEVQTPSAFAGLYFDVTETITVSAEGRYQEDRIAQTPLIGTNGMAVTGVGANTLRATYNSFSPRFSVDWNYAEGSTAYALYSKGTRPGGFNAGLVTSTQATLDALRLVVPNAGVAYDEEELENIEVGLKSTWLGGRARTQLTVYKSEWTNGQVSSSVPVNVGGTTNLIPLVVNNGLADLRGVEFEGEIRVTEGLRLSAAFGLNETEVKAFGRQGASGLPNCADCNNAYGSFDGVIGNELPTAPKVSWSLSADYEARLNDNLDWFSRLDWTHTGRKYTDLSNVAWVGEIENVNLRVGIRNEKYSFEIFGTNLTDDDTMLQSIPGVDVLTFSRIGLPGVFFQNEFRFSAPIPRSYGARFTYSF
jgi:iron complex outermembrane recepter protein